MSEIIYINEEHEQIVLDYLTFVQKQVYDATEMAESGKYNDFQDILSDILMYHNDFSDFGLKDDSVSEWLFSIPNLAMFTTLGFFAGLRNKSNKDLLDRCSGNIHGATMDTVGSLSDMLKDMQENSKVKEQC